VAADCDQSYVFCQSGSVVSSRSCPPGTRYHVDRRTCVDEELCVDERRSVDRNPRQIKFLLVDDLHHIDGAWRSRPVDRRQIKFRSVDGDESAMDRRRQIKFRSLPAEFDVESAIPGVGDGSRRPPRQIKFRSLADRAIEAKKHDDEEERRQVKFDAFSDTGNQRLVNYGAQPLAAYYFKRR